jgi:hypothetical protein
MGLLICVGCGNPIPRDQQPVRMCPASPAVGCSGNVDVPSCAPNQTLDEWVEQMDVFENGNTDQPI